jgi:hypothetical protein
MAYKVIDHGKWEAYRPDPLPDVSAAFARRIGDGVDWYAFIQSEGQFYEGSILATALQDPATGVETVKAATRDETLIFPAGSRVIEILGVPANEPKPHDLLAWLNYDPATQTLFGNPSPPTMALRVSATQAKIQLSRMKRGDTNLLAMTEQVVAASQDTELQIWFRDARNWSVSSPNVLKIGVAFGLSREDIQAAFEAASKIEE